jgi:hypothetical protein
VFPYAYLIPKFHKGTKEPCWRPIVGTASNAQKTNTTDAQINPLFPPENYASAVNQHLSDFLRSVLDVFWWDDVGKPFKRIIVTPRDTGVINAIKRMNEMKNTPDFEMKQFDMGAMYAKLSQNEVLPNVTEMCRIAWDNVAERLKTDRNELCCTVSWDGAGHYVRTTWHTETQRVAKNRSQTIRFRDLCDMIRASVSNNVVHNDGEFYLQSAGLGMGNPASPLLATLCCAHVELSKRDALRPTTAQLREVLDFAFRYVDDCLCAEPVELPTEEEYNVPIKDKRNLRKTLFLGIEIEKQPHTKWDYGVIRKADVFNHEVPRFAHASSNHPRHNFTAGTTGNLVHLYARCSTTERFLDNARDLFSELSTQRGYESEVLHKAINAFITTHVSGQNKRELSHMLHNLARTASQRLPGGESPPLCRCGFYHFGRCARCWGCGWWGHIRRDCPREAKHHQHTRGFERDDRREQAHQDRRRHNQTQPEAERRTNMRDPFLSRSIATQTDCAHPCERCHPPTNSWSERAPQNRQHTNTGRPFPVPNAGNSCFFTAVFHVASCINRTAGHKILKSPPHLTAVADFVSRWFHWKPQKGLAHRSFDPQDFGEAWSKMSRELLGSASVSVTVRATLRCTNGHDTTEDITVPHLFLDTKTKNIRLSTSIEHSGTPSQCFCGGKTSVDDSASTILRTGSHVLLFIDRVPGDKQPKLKFEFKPTNCTLRDIRLCPEATVIHKGDRTGGHYMTFVQRTNAAIGQGWLCSDEKIEQTNALPPCAIRENYAVLYRVMNSPPPPQPRAEEPKKTKTKLYGPPSGTFWMRDGAEFMEMRTLGSAQVSTGTRTSEEPTKYYERRIDRYVTHWWVVGARPAAQPQKQTERPISVSSDSRSPAASPPQQPRRASPSPDPRSASPASLVSGTSKATDDIQISQLSAKRARFRRTPSHQETIEKESESGSRAFAQSTSTPPTPLESPSATEQTSTAASPSRDSEPSDQTPTDPPNEFDFPAELRKMRTGDRYTIRSKNESGKTDTREGTVKHVYAAKGEMWLQTPFEGHDVLLLVPSKGWTVLSAERLSKPKN